MSKDPRSFPGARPMVGDGNTPAPTAPSTSSPAPASAPAPAPAAPLTSQWNTTPLMNQQQQNNQPPAQNAPVQQYEQGQQPAQQQPAAQSQISDDALFDRKRKLRLEERELRNDLSNAKKQKRYEIADVKADAASRDDKTIALTAASVAVLFTWLAFCFFLPFLAVAAAAAGIAALKVNNARKERNEDNTTIKDIKESFNEERLANTADKTDLAQQKKLLAAQGRPPTPQSLLALPHNAGRPTMPPPPAAMNAFNQSAAAQPAQPASLSTASSNRAAPSTNLPPPLSIN